MKVTITHLKAAWPAGAKVGDVLELESVPAWAVGKCVPAADDAEPTVFAVPADDADGQPAAPVSEDEAKIAESLAAAEAQAAEEEAAAVRRKGRK